LFDLNEDGLLSLEDLSKFINSMGINYTTPQQLYEDAGAALTGGVNFSKFKELVLRQIVIATTKNKHFYMLITLEEAEHLRGIIHGRKGRSLLPSESHIIDRMTNARIWAMGDIE